MMEDLSRYHYPVSTLFARSTTSDDWDRYRLSEEQLEFFRENGYLKGIRILTDEQVEVLRAELQQLMDPGHSCRHLFHEYHSNESTDPNRVVFHALGAWRALPGFHDLLWRSGALLARPAFLQTGTAWRCGGLAPGLFVLDKNEASGAPHLLDWLGRFNP